MGEVTFRVKLSNQFDIERSASGEDVQLRTVEVDAIVDTGAVRSVIPARIAEALGLRVVEGRQAQLADGNAVPTGRVRGLLFEILGRDTQEEAMVLGDEVLIGQTTLEATDLVVDCANQRVYPNPDNPTWTLKIRLTPHF
jgi:clan AA aspartic protease